MGCVVALVLIIVVIIVIIVVVVVVLEDLDIVALGVHPLSQILPVPWLMLGRLDFVKLGVLPSDPLAGVHPLLVEKWVVLAVGDLVEIVAALHYFGYYNLLA